jgi:hypothetical protein
MYDITDRFHGEREVDCQHRENGRAVDFEWESPIPPLVSSEFYLDSKTTHCTQRKVIAGAEVMLLPSMYPNGPATMQPTMSPITIDADFIAGDPTNSRMMIVTKERKPSPMYSGEPQGRA